MSGYTPRRSGRAGHIMDHDRGQGFDAIEAAVTLERLGKLAIPVKQKKPPVAWATSGFKKLTV